MQNTASVPPDQFSDLLKRFPAALDLDALALETKAIRRKRKSTAAQICYGSRWRAAQAGFRILN